MAVAIVVPESVVVTGAASC